MLMRIPCAGVDISAEWLDVSMPQIKLKERFDNNLNGFKLFLKRLKKHGIEKARICMEATGLYFEKLAEFLHAHGYEVVVVNPQCIKSFARSELRRSKSDPLDAALIQVYCEEKYERLHLWQPLPEEYKCVREILRRRQTLVDERTAEKNRKAAGFSSEQVLKSIAKSIEFLNNEINALEAEALKIVKAHPEMNRLVNLIESIPGVSFLTAAVVLVEVPRVLWNGRLAAVFAGVIPSKNSSGKSQRSSYLSRVGSSRLRHALYMPALSASQCNPVLHDFYQRLLGRGLRKKQALTAVMRKLLHLIFGVVQTGIRFDVDYERKRAASAIAA
jgi:transposase